MLTPRGKSPLPEKNLLRGGSNPRLCNKQDSEPASPKHYQRAIPAPNRQTDSRPIPTSFSELLGDFCTCWYRRPLPERLGDLVGRRPPREREIRGRTPLLLWNHTCDLKCGALETTPPGALRYRCYDWLARCQYTLSR